MGLTGTLGGSGAQSKPPPELPTRPQCPLFPSNPHPCRAITHSRGPARKEADVTSSHQGCVMNALSPTDLISTNELTMLLL